MKKWRPECEESLQIPKIPVAENKAAICFLNPRKLLARKVTVDGCVYREESKGIRCDYLLITEHDAMERFIELKAKDVNHAFKQLEASIEALSASPRTSEKNAYVVTSNYHPGKT